MDGGVISEQDPIDACAWGVDVEGLAIANNAVWLDGKRLMGPGDFEGGWAVRLQCDDSTGKPCAKVFR